MLSIRRATDADWDSLWEIFHAVVRKGDTYSYAPETTQEEGRALWMAPAGWTYVACRGEQIVGTYLLKPNQPGLGFRIVSTLPKAFRHQELRLVDVHVMYRFLHEGEDPRSGQ